VEQTEQPGFPFLGDRNRPRVAVGAGQGAYDNARTALATWDLSPASGRRVLLKPNAGRIAGPGAGITTHPQVVAAAIDAFREAGAETAVGESPICGVSTMDAFEATGIAAVARERDCPLIDMDARPFRKTPVPDGVAIQSLRVCPEACEFDIVVSIPVMKMHMHTGVTLSVKNMKGCLWRRSKVDLHMLPPVEGVDDKPLDIAIADLSGVLRPDLAIVDGTVGMEGLGPSAGSPKPLDAVVVSADPFAADAVSCALMGLDAHAVPHLRLGADRGYGVIDLGSIQVGPGDWRRFALPFASPPTDLAMEFPDFRVLDRQSCSACQSTLLLLLERYGSELLDYFPAGASPAIAIGRGHTELPNGTLCIGNCTRKHRAVGVYVAGCPPVSSEILRAVSGEPRSDSQDGRPSAS
jgi:uncharacterized protein (DUF362 family)